MNINELFSDDMADAGKRLWERRRRKITESAADDITKAFANMYDPVISNLHRVAVLAMQGRQNEAAAQLRTVIKSASPDIQKKITDAVNNIKPVMVNSRIADTSTLEKSKQHQVWIQKTFIPWVQSTMNKGVTENKLDESKCPHCGGEMISEDRIDEKKDACYYKVKSRYKVWPSAYASGALVKCRKKGAKNWGNKSESIDEDEQLDEDLKKWFKEKWVRFGPDGKIKGDCARGKDSEGKPKCLPQSKAHALGKKGRASAARRKRKQDPNPERRGKAINVATKKNESVMSDMDIDMQDITWDQIVGAVTIAVRIGEDADKFIGDWADQESIDMQRIEQELQERGFENIDVLQDHIEQHGGRYVPPDFDLSETIRKIGDNKYRLYSGKGKNLGTFDSRAGAEKHEREVQYFKHANESQITDQEIAAYLREMRDAGYGV
jgi:hypothetical protein